MYGIYKRDHNNQPCLVAVCYTEVGARRSCSHFKKHYEQDHGAICPIEYRYLDSYWTMKIGYNVLRLVRAYERNKLARLENKESTSRVLRENQEAKIRSLY